MVEHPMLCLAVILATVAGVALIFRGGPYILAALFLLINALLLFALTYFNPSDGTALLWPALLFFVVAAVQVLFGQVIIYYRHHGRSRYGGRSRVGPEQDDVL